MQGKTSIGIVIPVYNECGTIQAMVEDIIVLLNKYPVNYTFYIINDGSNDNTALLLDDLAKRYQTIKVLHQENQGHGPAILNGYKMATPNNEWVWQMDSDYQFSLEKFEKFYTNLNGYDFLIAYRNNSHSSAGRKLISTSLYLFAKLLYGSRVKDTNMPYRMMRSSILQNILPKINAKAFAPNTLISAYFVKNKFSIYNTKAIPSHMPIKRSNFNSYILKGSIKSFWELLLFRWKA
jgi:dolichol-phosphate mannosyltransferase